MKRVFIIVFALLSTSIVRADEGMWLLSLLGKNIEQMQAQGCKLTAEDIYSVNQASLKDAIVGLGKVESPFWHFCSGEIISDKGLVLTNHHCGFDVIQKHSTLEHDYLTNGFWAYKHSDELPNPGITASILQRMEDVTDQVNAVLNDNMTEEERAEAIERISGQIIAKAVQGTNLRAQVKDMFEGNQFFLLVYKIYQDVRLVGAPPQSMGKFGGDTDNWVWPRHTADFSMMRIYTGPNGEPASYSPNNVPLKPRHHLPVSAKGVQDGDFAMIMGFPGTTDRFLTSFGLKETMDVTNDIRYKVRTEKLRVMKEGMDADPKTRIQYASKHAQCANYWKYSHEQNIALKNLNTMGEKEKIEREFTTWVNADPARQAKYGKVLSMIKEGYEAMHPYNEASSYMQEAALQGPEVPLFAFRVSNTLERALDAEKTPAPMKDMFMQAIRENAKAFFKDFNRDVDKNLMATLFKMYNDNVAAEWHPEVINMINKKYKGNYEKFAKELSDKSIFTDEARFNAFLEKPDMKKLQKDLGYITGKSIFETYQKLGGATNSMRNNIAKGDRLFVRGLMEMNPEKVWAPNANSTIRLTYGNVKSYKPRDAVFYDYYTTLTGVMEKEGPKGGEFEVPQQLKDLYNAKNFGRYGADNISVNFITNNDITGGNSGSPVINGYGELIGTAFDGNSEAMSGDIDFEENLQRCINLDTRYMLFIVDKMANAQNLIDEMTIVY
ncbi:S46 family peptidase [Butyricimonas paravirosa]|uniref:S46 family peptidase n=1 Tax=Butyricimonas paravirosa TaxID=1472417 RepID=UPI002109F4AF|nr:S46 family peptidase [Butyricimonas paravirosa]MCQ4875299.1 S46 family peptidase [Butyricimonas paravirosa]